MIRTRVIRASRILSLTILIVVFSWSGLAKLLSVPASVHSVRAFHIVGFPLDVLIGIALPVVELGLAVGLAWRRTRRLSAILAVCLMVVFIACLISLWVRRLPLDCGCFGPSQVSPSTDFVKYAWFILRDVVLGLCALLLLRRGSVTSAVDDGGIQDALYVKGFDVSEFD